MSLNFQGPTAVSISLNVNGQAYALNVEPRRTLLSVLREELGLTGTKHGCGRGQCGACTVIIDDETAYACLTLAIDCQGRAIRTVEQLADSDTLHPVQQAFIEQDGYQCGFCTPGQIMSAVSLLEHAAHPDEETIRQEMAGNLCRCGAYPNIIKAVLSAAEKEA